MTKPETKNQDLAYPTDVQEAAVRIVGFVDNLAHELSWADPAAICMAIRQIKKEADSDPVPPTSSIFEGLVRVLQNELDEDWHLTEDEEQALGPDDVDQEA